ncbi:MAG: twin-arginine translocase TatA/TatE family subunit [Acidobacteria bacterium]|nr:twin-arginine translocase TatA/TatE family subunit [Acidobacteriota bacterium]
MPSFADSIVIFVIALILFGPKKLPQLARQLGKLMGEFRRASNDFRMQMEEEMRVIEQEENQKKFEATTPSMVVEEYPEPEHPHLTASGDDDGSISIEPIAESGDLKMMPPSTGLPEPASARPTGSSNAGLVAVEDPPPAIAEDYGDPDQLHG